MGYEFEWDPAKAAANLKQHGVSFDEATTVFGDRFSLNTPDPAHSAEEDRFLLLGMTRRKRWIAPKPASRRN